MLAITHKIVAESLYIERTTGLLPTDSLDRFDIALKLNRNFIANGRSLLSSFEPVEYCLDVLRWPEVLALGADLAEIKRRYYNPGRLKLLPFKPGSLFVPFTNVMP
jgi:hypothetical protein